MVNLKTWDDCVAAAKQKYGVTGYGMVRGRVLKEAQRAYYSIMVSSTKK